DGQRGPRGPGAPAGPEPGGGPGGDLGPAGVERGGGGGVGPRGDEGRASPGGDEGRERAPERAPGAAIERDAGREHDGAERLPAGRPAEREALERRAEEDQREQPVVDAGHPERLTGCRRERDRRGGVGRPHADDERHAERRIDSGGDHEEPSRKSCHAGAACQARTAWTAATVARSTPISNAHTPSVCGAVRLARNAPVPDWSITISR